MSTIRVLVDSRSVPKTMGNGPMSRTPAPRVFPAPDPLLAAKKITATNAIIIPTMTRKKPIAEMEISVNLLSPERIRIKREL